MDAVGSPGALRAQWGSEPFHTTEDTEALDLSPWLSGCEAGGKQALAGCEAVGGPTLATPLFEAGALSHQQTSKKELHWRTQLEVEKTPLAKLLLLVRLHAGNPEHDALYVKLCTEIAFSVPYLTPAIPTEECETVCEDAQVLLTKTHLFMPPILNSLILFLGAPSCTFKPRHLALAGAKALIEHRSLENLKQDNYMSAADFAFQGLWDRLESHLRSEDVPLANCLCGSSTKAPLDRAKEALKLLQGDDTAVLAGIEALAGSLVMTLMRADWADVRAQAQASCTGDDNAPFPRILQLLAGKLPRVTKEVPQTAGQTKFATDVAMQMASICGFPDPPESLDYSFLCQQGGGNTVVAAAAIGAFVERKRVEVQRELLTFSSNQKMSGELKAIFSATLLAGAIGIVNNLLTHLKIHASVSIPMDASLAALASMFWKDLQSSLSPQLRGALQAIAEEFGFPFEGGLYLVPETLETLEAVEIVQQVLTLMFLEIVSSTYIDVQEPLGGEDILSLATILGALTTLCPVALHPAFEQYHLTLDADGVEVLDLSLSPGVTTTPYEEQYLHGVVSFLSNHSHTHGELLSNGLPATCRATFEETRKAAHSELTYLMSSETDEIN